MNRWDLLGRTLLIPPLLLCNSKTGTPHWGIPVYHVSKWRDSNYSAFRNRAERSGKRVQNTAFHGVKVNTADRFSLAIREKIRETARVISHSRRIAPITGEIFRNPPEISFFPALREISPAFQSPACLADSSTGGEVYAAPRTHCVLYTESRCQHCT